MERPDDDDVPRNVVDYTLDQPPHGFELLLGVGVELVSERHDGDTTVLTLRRIPRAEA